MVSRRSSRARWVHPPRVAAILCDGRRRASLPDAGVRSDGGPPDCVAYGSSDVLSTHRVAIVSVDVEEIRQCRSKFHPRAEKKLCGPRIRGGHSVRRRVFSFIAVVMRDWNFEGVNEKKPRKQMSTRLSMSRSDDLQGCGVFVLVAGRNQHKLANHGGDGG